MKKLEEIEQKLKFQLELVQKTIIKAKLKLEPPANDCVICYDSEAVMIFVPCGHLCTCESCSKKPNLLQCPICRGDIQQKLKVYKPT